LVFVDRIVEMACTDEVLGQNQRVSSPIPNGDGPVTDQLCKGISSPALVCICNNREISRTRLRLMAQQPDEVLAIVESAVPGDDNT
jgi:hypothetical protein